MKGIAVGVLALVLLAGSIPALFALGFVVAPSRPSYACGSSASVVPAVSTSSDFDAEQLANARIIITIGQSRDVPAYGWVVAIAAAIQESGLRNLSYGDRDSLGLFQQRPSAGWGTPAQIMDPVYASGAFYEHLVRVPGWEQMPVTAAAQAVQRSGFPDAYAAHESAARALVAERAPDADVSGLAASSDCAVASAGIATDVVMPLPAGTYRDLNNYGRSGSPWASMHTGDDLSAPCGTPVLAATAGTIGIESGGSWSWSGRWLVEVATGPGSLTTWYGHMQALSVATGQLVRAGQQIGQVGSLGNATGCHLHFEVHPRGGGYLQDQIDPVPWLAANVGHSLGPLSAPGAFRVATFNVLGSSHTGPGGDQHPTWPSGAQRIVGAMNLLDARGVSVAGLQEFERPQHAVFKRRYAGRWAAWHPKGDTRNAVIWRTDTWQLAAVRSFAIPYIRGTDDMPVVLLRHRTTGAQLYVVNVHNPSNMYGPFAGQRARALRIESDVIDQLLKTGTPIVFIGDFNAADEPVCTFTPRLADAFGPVGKPCRAHQGEGVDHIFSAGVTFIRTTSARTPVRQRISDHNLLIATAR